MKVYKHDVEIRVRYSETDQMGYVYYGNYAAYFEVARVETMRSLGISYSQLEAEGIMMPVSQYTVQFKAPCQYDELLTIRTEIRELPTSRIRFHYSTFNESGVLANEAYTELYFMNSEKKRPVRAPEQLIRLLMDRLN